MTEFEPTPVPNTDRSPPTGDEIRTWMVNGLSWKLGMEPHDIPLDQPLIHLGMDSMEFVGLVADLERQWGLRFMDNPLIDYPTLNALSTYLADQLARGRTEIDPSRKDDGGGSPVS